MIVKHFNGSLTKSFDSQILSGLNWNKIILIIEMFFTINLEEFNQMMRPNFKFHNLCNSLEMQVSMDRPILLKQKSVDKDFNV